MVAFFLLEPGICFPLFFSSLLLLFASSPKFPHLRPPILTSVPPHRRRLGQTSTMRLSISLPPKSIQQPTQNHIKTILLFITTFPNPQPNSPHPSHRTISLLPLIFPHKSFLPHRSALFSPQQAVGALFFLSSHHSLLPHATLHHKALLLQHAPPVFSSAEHRSGPPPPPRPLLTAAVSTAPAILFLPNDAALHVVISSSAAVKRHLELSLARRSSRSAAVTLQTAPPRGSADPAALRRRHLQIRHFLSSAACTPNAGLAFFFNLSPGASSPSSSSAAARRFLRPTAALLQQSLPPSIPPPRHLEISRQCTSPSGTPPLLSTAPGRADLLNSRLPPLRPDRPPSSSSSPPQVLLSTELPTFHSSLLLPQQQPSNQPSEASLPQQQ